MFKECRSEKSLKALSKLVTPKCHWYVSLFFPIDKSLVIYFIMKQYKVDNISNNVKINKDVTVVSSGVTKMK